jgi:hypothetical protein
MDQDATSLFSPANAVGQPTMLPQEGHNRRTKIAWFLNDQSKRKVCPAFAGAGVPGQAVYWRSVHSEADKLQTQK